MANGGSARKDGFNYPILAFHDESIYEFNYTSRKVQLI